jgi:hypothetical protein
VTTSPLRHVLSFWKPLIGADELEELASYGAPADELRPGINAWLTDSVATGYRVRSSDGEFSLFAGVHAIGEVPPSAEAVAEILDWSGGHHSYVLWYPRERALVIPFDPNQAVEAFRREEYVPAPRRTALPMPVLTLYYAIFKRVCPRSLKGWLRRIMARRAFSEDRFLEWPVDMSLDDLQRFLLKTILIARGGDNMDFVWFWPDGHPWAAVLTHDVETASGLAGAPNVAELELSRGFRSSFNLVPMDYEIPGSALSVLRERGFEIGVHGFSHDGMLFSKWSAFMKRVPTINECARQWGAMGFRSPATYRNPEWFHMLGFEYDSSVFDSDPFEPQPGGCASVFPFMIDGVVEVPITMPQDHTLFALLGHTDSDIWLTKLARIRNARGMACILTHPDPTAGYVGRPENAVLYGQLLDALKDSDVWTPLPRDLARWWRRRAESTAEDMGDLGGASIGKAALNDAGQLEIVPPPC